jgi:hypothetical protein
LMLPVWLAHKRRGPAVPEEESEKGAA